MKAWYKPTSLTDQVGEVTAVCNTTAGFTLLNETDLALNLITAK